MYECLSVLTFTHTLNDGVDNVTYRAFEDLYMYT